nr:uncharacterized protein LOC113804245 [Penaeus vannamei]
MASERLTPINIMDGIHLETTFHRNSVESIDMKDEKVEAISQNDCQDIDEEIIEAIHGESTVFIKTEDTGNVKGERPVSEEVKSLGKEAVGECDLGIVMCEDVDPLSKDCESKCSSDDVHEGDEEAAKEVDALKKHFLCDVDTLDEHFLNPI